MPTLADYPHVAAQLDRKKNGRLAPEAIAAGSKRQLWWRCVEDPAHVWQTSPVQRTRRGSGCPVCRKRVPAARSLLSQAPALAREWHPTKNGALRPDSVYARTGRVIWWKCPNGPDHEWEAAVVNRTRGKGCPCCAGRRVSVTNSLATRAPEAAAEWYRSKNRPATPETTLAGSAQIVWWKCRRGHEWQAAVRSRGNGGYGCPYCVGNRFTLSKSLAVRRPEIAAQWHPTRNGALLPRQVTSSSARRVWWKCPNGPDHEWETVLFHRTLRGSGCPFCADRRFSVTNSLAVRAPGVAAEWHRSKNRPATPQTTYGGGRQQAWWKCPKGHEWRASIGSRVVHGTGCPFCSHHQVTLGNSLAVLAPEIAAQWHPTKNGALLPREVSVGSGRQVWWKCPEGADHEWQLAVGARTQTSRGCPFCGNRRVSKTNALAARFPEVAREWHPTRNGALLPAEVTVGTHRYVWWRCASGHDWRATVKQRALVGTGCYRCFRIEQKREAAARRKARGR